MLKYSDLNSNEKASKWVSEHLPYFKLVGTPHYEENLDKFGGKLVVDISNNKRPVKMVMLDKVSKISIRQNVIPIQFNNAVNRIDDYSLPSDKGIVYVPYTTIKEWVFYNQDTFVSYGDIKSYYLAAGVIEVNFNKAAKSKLDSKFLKTCNKFEAYYIKLTVPVQKLGTFKIDTPGMRYSTLRIRDDATKIAKIDINSKGIIIVNEANETESIPYKKLSTDSKVEVFNLLRQYIATAKIRGIDNLKIDIIDENGDTYVDNTFDPSKIIDEIIFK